MSALAEKVHPAPKASRATILVVEDEDDIRELLSYQLAQEGFDVKTAGSGADALVAVDKFIPDLVLLDLMLPDMGGFDVCRRIRQRPGAQPAIIILTARTDEIDRVLGFELGANDYVIKPASRRELALRIQARLAERRPTPAVVPETTGGKRLVVGALEIDPLAYRVSVAGEEVPISVLEMQLLMHLAEAKGSVCSRRDLLTHVWRYSPEVNSRTVDTHVKRLRDKLGVAGNVIHTVRGVGYRMDVPT